MSGMCLGTDLDGIDLLSCPRTIAEVLDGRSRPSGVRTVVVSRQPL